MHEPIIWPDGSRYGQEIAARQDDALDDAIMAHLRALTQGRNPAEPCVVVYDLGGASGYRAAQFAALGCTVYVVDKGDFTLAIAERRRLLQAQGKPADIRFVQADAFACAQLDLPRADAIYSSCMAHFALPEKNLDMLLQARRALREGGRFFMRVTGGYEDYSPRYFRRTPLSRFRTPFILNPARRTRNVPVMDYARGEVYGLFKATGYAHIRIRRVYRGDYFYVLAEATNPPLQLVHRRQARACSAG